MEDRRNLIIAIILTALVLFGWPMIANQFLPQEPAPASQTQAGKGSASTPAVGAPTADADLSGGSKSATVSLQSALAGSPRVKIRTPRLEGSINLNGARIDDLLLLDHRTDLSKKSPPVRLFAPEGTKGAYFARFGWVGTGMIAPDDKALWTTSGDVLAPEKPITLSFTNAAGQKFETIFEIDENYLITAKQRFVNLGSVAAQVANFGLLRRGEKSSDVDSFNVHAGPMGVFDGKPNYDWDYDDIAEEPSKEKAFTSTGGWIGFTDQYWLGALIPDQKTKVNAKFLERGGAFVAQLVGATQTAVAPGQQVTQTSRLFAGAKEVAVLKDYSDREGIPYLDYSIDWGWFWFIAIPFFWILHWLFGIVGNFGVAIIGLTIIVRFFMFPIANRQFKSMAEMRAVQPEMKRIQERYKDDKPKLQQEMMKLYKDHNVNPLAGCLPIFLQIPIFFALYKVLLLSIEMRHQSFLPPWIKDLSAPDPWTPVNLFGLIPFDPPAMLTIGILPILLGVTMWLMQRLNPQPMDEMQKQIFGLMPWFLMFIMAPFAAGLQLYWVVSNIISIGQQKLLYSRHPQLKEQMAKEAAEKAREKAEAKA